MATGSFAGIPAASREAGDRYVNSWAGVQPPIFVGKETGSGVIREDKPPLPPATPEGVTGKAYQKSSRLSSVANNNDERNGFV